MKKKKEMKTASKKAFFFNTEKNQQLIKAVSEKIDLHINIKNFTADSAAADTSKIFAEKTTTIKSDQIVFQFKSILQMYTENSEYQEYVEDVSGVQQKSKQKRNLKQLDLKFKKFKEKSNKNSIDNHDSDEEYQNIDTDEQNNTKIFEDLMSMTFQEVKAELKNMSALDQEDLDQKKLNIQIVLNLNFNKIYTDMNFNNQKILKHILILLCQTQFDADASYLRIIFHINYDALSVIMNKIIEKQMLLNTKTICQLHSLFSETSSR